MDNARKLMDIASQNGQFLVFGDTHHNLVPLSPITDNLDIPANRGHRLLFIEQHISFQPYIEKLIQAEITESEFIESANCFNENNFWGHQDIADLVIGALKSGIMPIAFDTRTPEELGIKGCPSAAHPHYIKDYPNYLKEIVGKAVRDSAYGVSFDKRSAQIVTEITEGQKALVYIGNGHINGTYKYGDLKGDFDEYLGDKAIRISLHYNEEDTIKYVTNKERQDSCIKQDQPDFLYVVTEDLALASQMAVDRGLYTGDLNIAKKWAGPCYELNEQALSNIPSLLAPKM